MKDPYFKYLYIFAFLALITVVLSQCTSSQHVFKNGEVEAMVNAHEFKFVAESAIPLRQKVRNFTSNYDVTVKNDSLVSYLPYFGRAHRAPMDPTDIGIQFTSTNFSYQVQTEKSNNWKVTIKPNDQAGIQEFNFDIFANGNATLHVTSTSRDPISFRGRIEKVIPSLFTE